MSKTTTPSGADAKKAATTKTKNANTQLAIRPPQKTTAELIEEQKNYFAHKNEILRKLAVFERNKERLSNVLKAMKESEKDNESNMFSEDSSLKMSLTEGYNTDVCTIKSPIVIISVITAVLEEIEKSRLVLEMELLND